MLTPRCGHSAGPAQRSQTDQRAFALPECLVALAISSVALLTLILLGQRALRQLADGVLENAASALTTHIHNRLLLIESPQPGERRAICPGACSLSDLYPDLAVTWTEDPTWQAAELAVDFSPPRSEHGAWQLSVSWTGRDGSRRHLDSAGAWR